MSSCGFNKLFFLCLIVSIFIGHTATSIASDKRKTQKELKSIESQINQKNKSLKKDQKQQQQAQEQIKAGQKKLVEISKKLVLLEQDASNVQQRIEQLTARQDRLTKIIQENSQKTGDLIILLARLKRTPPANLLTEPHNMLKTARADLLISRSLPAVQQQLDFLKKTIQELEQTQIDLAEKQTRIATLLGQRQQEQQELKKILTTQKAMIAQRTLKNHQTTKEMERLAGQAESLRDLITKLEQQEQKTALLTTKLSLPSPKPDNTSTGRIIQQAQGLPVAGIIKTRYGDQNEFDLIAKGVTIQPLDKALVVAPWDGIVRFSGPFKRHQNIVILEHNDRMMSLIGGLQTLYVTTGQNILSGEPLGQAFPNKQYDIYYELRRKGRIVNPLQYTSTLAKNQ